MEIEDYRLGQAKNLLGRLWCGMCNPNKGKLEPNEEDSYKVTKVGG